MCSFCSGSRGIKRVTCTAKAEGQEFDTRTTFNVKRPNATLEATIQAGVEVWNNQLRFQNSFIDGITFMGRDKDTDGGWELPSSWAPALPLSGRPKWPVVRGEGQGYDTSYPGIDRDSPGTELPSGGSVTTADGSFTTYWHSDQHLLMSLCRFGKSIGTGRAMRLRMVVAYGTSGTGTATVDHADAPAPPTISWTSNIMRTLQRIVPEN